MDNSVKWTRMGPLSFDSMSIKNKIKFDPYSQELVGFEEGGLNEDILIRKLGSLDNQKSNDGTKTFRAGSSQQFLIFIFNNEMQIDPK